MKFITDELVEIVNEVCDKYCKYPEQYYSQYKDPDEACDVLLKERCENCPLNRI